jgi:uncharacterized membrane protein
MWCMLHHLLGHSGPSGTHSNVTQESAPLDILKRRYALGEISREQFEQMVRVLGSADGSSARAHHERHA